MKIRILIVAVLLLLGLALGWWLAHPGRPVVGEEESPGLQEARTIEPTCPDETAPRKTPVPEDAPYPPLPRDLAYLTVDNDSTRPHQSIEKLNEYIDPVRDSWQKPNQVLECLKIRPGQVVADIGCGSGYFTFRLAREVGAEGKVYALDSDIAAIYFMLDRIRRQKAANVHLLMSEEDSVGLDDHCLDLAFVCDVHNFSKPGKVSRSADLFYQSIWDALKDQGRLAIIEGKNNVPIGADDIIWGVRRSGFILEERHDFLEFQHFLIFRKARPEIIL